MRLQLSEVSRSFGTRVVLRNITLDLETGSLAIIGSSGGGKSTLLRILGGLIAPDQGTVMIDGVPVGFREPAASQHRASVGFVFQSNGLFDHLTGLENVILPLVHVHRLSKAEAQARALGLMERFGLTGERDKRPQQMSGGQQQRLSIVRAVAIQPRLLLLDEPTSALDPEYTADVLKMVRELARDGLPTVLVTHHMGFARHACEHVAFLHDGQLAEVGASNKIFANPENPALQRFLARVLEWDE